MRRGDGIGFVLIFLHVQLFMVSSTRSAVNKINLILNFEMSKIQQIYFYM